MTQDTKYSLVAFAGGVAVMCLLVFLGLEFEGINWVKWFGLALWTAGIFGLLVYGYGQGLKKAKPMAVLLAAFGLHLSVMIPYLRSVPDFPDLFFLFFGPVEVAVVVAAMTVLTDVDFRGSGGARPRREKWPPPGWHKDPGAARKRNGPK